MKIVQEFYLKFVISEIKNTEVIPDINEWKHFLESLPLPKDRINESFLKYCCRMHLFPAYKRVLLNCSSFFVLLVFLARSLRNHNTLPSAKDSHLLLEIKPNVQPYDVYPAFVINEFDTYDEVDACQYKPEYLTMEGRQLFYRVLRRYPLRPYFLLLVIIHLSKHCYYMSKYNPSAVMVYSEERNVAGPILTEFYEAAGRELISFIHGEYLLQLVQAYMDFSRFYIWYSSYQEMFSNILKCNIQTYCVYTPMKLTKKWHLENVKPTYFCTYYFSGESKKAIQYIAELFKRFKECGKECKIRPHPRYSNLSFIMMCFPTDMVEDPHEVTLEDSLGQTNYVVGSSTTVHSEAFIEGRTVVVDDMSEPERYKNLKERYYIALKRPHMLLSDVVKMVFADEKGL